MAGTRIPVSLILNLLAHGQTIPEIIDDYPELTKEDIKAAVKFAEKVVDEGKLPNIAVAHEISHRRGRKL